MELANQLTYKNPGDPGHINDHRVLVDIAKSIPEFPEVFVQSVGDLADVAEVVPEHGHVLQWNDNVGAWVSTPADLTGGGESGALVINGGRPDSVYIDAIDGGGVA